MSAKAALCCQAGRGSRPLCSRQAAGCLLSVLSVLESECEAPRGCVCAPASASTTHCCTYNCFLTKALLVLCQEEEGKLEIQRNIRARLQNPLFSLG